MTVTRAQVLEALREQGDRRMTYVIRNVLAANYYRWKLKNLKTDEVRRVLEKLERGGFVERVASSYSRQICWALTPLGREVGP